MIETCPPFWTFCCQERDSLLVPFGEFLGGGCDGTCWSSYVGFIASDKRRENLPQSFGKHSFLKGRSWIMYPMFQERAMCSPSPIVTAVRRIRKGNNFKVLACELSNASFESSSLVSPGSGRQVPWFRWHQRLRRDFLAGPPTNDFDSDIRPIKAIQSCKTMTLQEFYTSLAPYVDIQVPTVFLVTLVCWMLVFEWWTVGCGTCQERPVQKRQEKRDGLEAYISQNSQSPAGVTISFTSNSKWDHAT